MDWAALHRDAEERFLRARRQRRARLRERLLLLWWWLVASLVPWIALMHEAGPFETAGDLASMALGQSAFALPAGALLLLAWAALADMYRWLRTW